MTDFEYTDFVETNSTAVDQAWYNRNDNTLVLDLNDNVYRYENVPVAEWNRLNDLFRTGGSIGRQWLPQFKRSYGPSEFLGNYYEIGDHQVEVNRQTVQTPKGLTPTRNAPTNNRLSLVVNQAPEQSNVLWHEVEFKTDKGVFTHRLRAESVDEAKTEAEKVFDMLDIDAKVTAVTVRFE